MSTYLPEDVETFRDPAGEEWQMFLPPAPDALDVPEPGSREDAAEQVCTYLNLAACDPDGARLQWHMANVAAAPWTISEEDFHQLWPEMPSNAVFPCLDDADDYLQEVAQHLGYDGECDE